MGCTHTRVDQPSKSMRAASEEVQCKANEQNDDLVAKMTFINRVALFQNLPKDQHPIIATAIVRKQFNKDEKVIIEGEIGHEFYLICDGTADVLKNSPDGSDPRKVATLKMGDYFGEMALLRDEPRQATIVTSSAVLETLTLTRELFQSLGLNSKLQFAKRKAVGAGGTAMSEHIIKSDGAPKTVPKTVEEQELIAAALRGNTNLTSVVTLDDTRVKALADVAWRETVKAGEEVITEGSTAADYFYIIQDGSFEVFIADRPDTLEEVPHSAEMACRRGESKFVSTLATGDSFGELALLYFAPRAATVRSKGESSVWIIDRCNFKQILMQTSEEKVKEYKKYLAKVDILSPLLVDERTTLARALVEIHYTKDDAIVTQGESGSSFYILFDGEVKVLKSGEEVAQMSASLDDGTTQTFGEKALQNNDVRAATVKVTSDAARALVFDRETFNMLLGPLDALQHNQHMAGTAGNRAMADAQAKSQHVRKKINRVDLEKLGLLGCGGFGVVELVQHKDTKETFAMKGLNKGHVVKTQMQQSVMAEKSIMLMTSSDFIVKLYATYNSPQVLYFLLEVALGGELYAIYNSKGFYGSEKHAKYYIAGVMFAFEHLHERFVIYRDLKPENVLLNAEGHPKLTDMGLAKFVVGKTYTTCGTPDYFAPEVIATSGQTRAVDWWTLGIFLFELTTGKPPFESPNPMQTYAKIMKGIGKVSFPPKCAGSCADLVKSLLKKDPADRLPMRSDKKSLRCHRFYSGFDWDAMFGLSLSAPYKPIVKDATDIANFSARKEDMPPQLHYQDDGTGWDADFTS